jgi:hypothetical protein
MSRYRTLIGLLVGLSLVVQGCALAAAPRGQLAQARQSSAGAIADMPCHQHTGTAKLACCDQSCPDMTSCALGHLACVAPLVVSLPRASSDAPPFHAARALTPARASPLRPPITLQA